MCSLQIQLVGEVSAFVKLMAIVYTIVCSVKASWDKLRYCWSRLGKDLMVSLHHNVWETVITNFTPCAFLVMFNKLKNFNASYAKEYFWIKFELPFCFSPSYLKLLYKNYCACIILFKFLYIIVLITVERVYSNLN